MTAEGYPYACIGCQRVVGEFDHRRHGRSPMPPLCSSCEELSYSTWNGGNRAAAPVRHGAFMDRRIARQIGALSELIAAEAHRQNWPPEWRAKYAP